MILQSESALDLNTLESSVLLVGGLWSGGLNSLRDAALSVAREGQRIQVFDGHGDWTARQPAIGSHIQVIDKPYRRSPVLPAGQIQVWRAPCREPQDMDALWLALDPNSGAPGPDVFIFSRTLPMLRHGWATLDSWIGAWEDRTRIIFYVDGLDLYTFLLPLVREVILYPHEVGPEIEFALNAGGLSTSEWNNLPPGQFVRLPDPLNSVPTALPERFL